MKIAAVAIMMLNMLFVATPVVALENCKYVALTFDDGPNEHTDSVLNSLESHQAKATFFLIGSQVNNNFFTYNRIAANHEVANHSYSHSNYVDIGPVATAIEIGRTQSLLGNKPRFSRPPLGVSNSQIFDIQRSYGLEPVMWADVIADWNSPNDPKLIDALVTNIRPGDIVLLHDSNVYKILDAMLLKLKSNGYCFGQVTKTQEYNDRNNSYVKAGAW